MQELAEKTTTGTREMDGKRANQMKVSAQGFQIPDALSTASDTQVASRIESRSAALGPAAEASVFRRPVWLGESIWPFQTSAFEVEGCRIAFTDVGRGPVVLFVHTGFWSFIWRDVMLRLSGDFRCICFDAPGAGQSDRLPVGRISLDRASRVLTALIEHLDLRDIILVVHDLGGPSGIAGAAALANRIRALCIVNAFAWKPSGAAFRGMLAVMGSPIIREFNAFSGILPRITATTFGVARHMDEPSRKAFLAGIGRDGIRTFHAYMRDALRAGAIYERVGRALATQFRGLPVFTIFGERNDPLSFQPRWKELFPDARQVVVSKGNHFPMCDNPDLVAMSIRELHPKWRRSQ